MAHEVHLNGPNKMGDFSNDEGICIYLFRNRFVKLVTIIHTFLTSEMYLIQSLNNMACTCKHTIVFLCTCLHSLLGTRGTCCIACTQCIMTPLTFLCMLTSAPLSNSTWTHSMGPACEAIISAVVPSCNDKCISSWEYHQCQMHTTHQSDRENTRTSITHSSTTHTTTTKKPPLGGTYSAPSCPMMSYTAKILPPIPQQQTPFLHQDSVHRDEDSRHVQGPHSSTTEQTMHCHKALSVHCASSPECNIKVLITGTCKRGALDMCVVGIMGLCYQHIPLTFTPFLTSH